MASSKNLRPKKINEGARQYKLCVLNLSFNYSAFFLPFETFSCTFAQFVDSIQDNDRRNIYRNDSDFNSLNSNSIGVCFCFC